MSVKIDRIASSLIKEISFLLRTEVKNPHLKFISVTSVQLASDLGNAKVYVTTLNETKKEDVLKALKSASGFLRKELAHRVDIRHIPELTFVYDESIAYGQKIEKLIENMQKEES